MPVKLRVPNRLVSLIRSMHPDLKRDVRAALQMIQNNPMTAGKLLKAELDGLQSVRIRRYRIIYRMVSPNVVEIIAIGPRRSIYQETYRLISDSTA